MKIISNIKSSGRVMTILLSSCALLFTECKRTAKDEVALGDEKKVASANFYVHNDPKGYLTAFRTSNGNALTSPTGAPASVIDYSMDSSFFVAKFSEEVTWNLVIKGETSGATKVISGVSDHLDKSNALWTGNSDSVPFFMPGEKAVATISFLGSPITYTATINVDFPKVYAGLVHNGVRYLVIDDFETGGLLGSFSMTSISIDPFDTKYTTYGVSKEMRVSGYQGFYMKSYDSNWNGYLISKSTPDLFKNFGIKETNPENVYFNLYVYGTGASSTTVSFEVFEDEHSIPENQYNLLADDRYIADIIVSWTGWKLVSIPYSVFKKAQDPKAGGNGNGVRQPHLISGAAITLNSYPVAGKTVDAYVDLAVISIGGPFVP